MKECKYCRTKYDDNLSACPNCGGTKVITAQEKAEDSALYQKEIENREKAVAVVATKRKQLISVLVGIVVIIITAIALVSYNANKPLSNGMTQDQGDAVLAEGIERYENGDYEQAIKCLVQLPTDSKQYLEAQSVIEKSTQEYKIAIIEKATTYTDVGNYDAAISLIKNANALLINDSDLEKLYQDTYRTSVLASAEKYIESGDLATALSVIDSGQKELPNDVVLQDKYATVFSEYKAVIRQDAISVANEYVTANNYSAAISVLTEATSKIGSDSEVDALLTQYTNSYVDSVVLNAEQIYKPYDIDALNEATAVISQALTVLPNNDELQMELAKYKDLQPVSLMDMTTDNQSLYSGTSYRYEYAGEKQDSLGNTYFATLVPSDWSESSHPYGWDGGPWAIAQWAWLLDYQYSRVTGTFAFDGHYKSSPVEIALTVTKAANEDWDIDSQKKYTLTSSSGFLKFEVDLTGAKSVEFYIKQNEKGGTYLFLADVYFWK